MIDAVVPAVMAAEREAWYLRLLHEHGRAIDRLAATFERDPARRQDLVQDIWLALWQALPMFRGQCSERTFVFRLAHNRGVSHVQRWRLRRTDVLDEDAPLATAAPDPERTATDRERRAHLHAAVHRLPLGLRQTIVLALEGLSHREIGDVLGITENNVAVRLARARAALTEDLRSFGERL